MPTINYMDYTYGDDATADGTDPSTPYKTLKMASTGLTGGDEVRMAKSPADSALTGTFEFTVNSDSVTGTGTLFSSELEVGDFIIDPRGLYREVETVLSDTSLVLFKRYNLSESGVTCTKLGVTVVAGISSTTRINEVYSSGSSLSSMLKITGGWDLTGPIRNGRTNYSSIQTTKTLRYGYGLYLSSRNWVEFEHISVLRGDRGVYMANANNCLFTDIICMGSADESWFMVSSSHNTLVSPVISCMQLSSDSEALYFSNSNGNLITDALIMDAYAGCYMNGSDSNTIKNPSLFKCNEAIKFSNAHFNIFSTPTLDYCSRGVNFSLSRGNVVNGYSATNAYSVDVYSFAQPTYSEMPVILMQHFKVAGDDRCYFDFGISYKDTTDARSTQCLKYAPTSADYYMKHSFFFSADSGVAQTISAYIKDDVSFNGDIQAALYFMEEKITGWTEWTPTSSYSKKEIIAAAGDITEDGVLELRIKVRGTAGNVFVDDLATA